MSLASIGYELNGSSGRPSHEMVSASRCTPGSRVGIVGRGRCRRHRRVIAEQHDLRAARHRLLTVLVGHAERDIDQHVSVDARLAGDAGVHVEHVADDS